MTVHVPIRDLRGSCTVPTALLFLEWLKELSDIQQKSKIRVEQGRVWLVRRS